ncbi:MAG: hypothetical protein ACJ76Y_23880 [Thermoanaerobaculia bacterium]
MNIPRYWFRAKGQAPTSSGKVYDLVAWGWSSEGRDGAERKARERLAAFAQRVQQGLEFPRGYAYGDRPLREEILREIQGSDGEIAAVVTRNSYGSTVVNTAHALFADVDLPASSSGPSFLGRLFGKSAPSPEEAALTRLREGLQRASGGSFRIYRTAAGFRVLGTDRAYDPRSAETQALMTSIGADPAFMHLCRVQESFRARLTPKPWRCGQSAPPGRHPREAPDEQADFATWLASYDRSCQSKATCRFVETVGPGWVGEGIQSVLDLHDSATRASVALPLA